MYRFPLAPFPNPVPIPVPATIPDSAFLVFQTPMAVPGMIQTPWYSNDHLSNQNLSETTQRFARFLKNNIFPNSVKTVPGKMSKKDTKLKRLSIHVKMSRRATKTMGKRDCIILSFGKALDNIDLNQMSHRFVSGVLQND